ncbi:MAG TPA: hypothetical protein VKG25_24505 [Bryobacteraceae bacterium]|nr:hypothetical protein [Bryobacteraceae bacterium]
MSPILAVAHVRARSLTVAAVAIATDSKQWRNVCARSLTVAAR